MKNAIVWLHAGYRAGAIFDAVVILAMVFPSFGGEIFGVRNFSPGTDYRYAMMIAASLMLGWTCLLLWADRKPIERRGVLLLAAFPVLVCLAGAGAYAVASGFIRAGKMAPTWVAQGILTALLMIGYFKSAQYEAKRTSR